MEDRFGYILLGDSIPLPEVDVDESGIEVNPDFHTYISNIESQEDALREYEFETILDNIGKVDFKENYLEVINSIKGHTVREQILLCEKIIDKVEEVYDFVFPQNIKLYDFNDVNDVYNFIEFVEYDFEDFVADVWKFFGTELKKINIEDFCKKKSNEIIKEIEDQIGSHTLNQMVTIFLRTYNKDDLIEWFIEATERTKMFIVLKNFEKR